MFTTTLATWIDLHERRIEEASLNVTVLIICLIAFLFVSIFMVFCASKTIRNKYKSMLKPCCYKDGISNTSSNAHRNIESVPVSMTNVYPQRTNTPPPPHVAPLYGPRTTTPSNLIATATPVRQHNGYLVQSPSGNHALRRPSGRISTEADVRSRQSKPRASTSTSFIATPVRQLNIHPVQTITTRVPIYQTITEGATQNLRENNKLPSYEEVCENTLPTYAEVCENTLPTYDEALRYM